jgi:DNA-binding CsgD family transcriptional regulator
VSWLRALGSAPQIPIQIRVREVGLGDEPARRAARDHMVGDSLRVCRRQQHARASLATLHQFTGKHHAVPVRQAHVQQHDIRVELGRSPACLRRSRRVSHDLVAALLEELLGNAVKALVIINYQYGFSHAVSVTLPPGVGNGANPTVGSGRMKCVPGWDLHMRGGVFPTGRLKIAAHPSTGAPLARHARRREIATVDTLRRSDAHRTKSLRGRRSECDALDRLVASVRAGQSQALVLRGEAGVGKTALLAYLEESALGCRIARATGVESEMELALAGLHQLCMPFLDRIERLPGPQRDALAIAFGLHGGEPPAQFLVGLAVLTLLSEVADEQPLICIVDDAQWLDRTSAPALAFLARRLAAEPVGLVFAAREHGGEQYLSGLPELVIEGLHDGDARALLESVLAGPIDERVRDRIVAETRGNPLALLELPRGLTAMQVAGGFGLLGGQPLSGRIAESFQRQLGELPAEAARLLLVAAAEPVGDPLLVWCAAERLGIDGSAATETNGLLTIGDRVTFRHPLVRSAVYRSAPARARRAAHLALAEVTDPEVDPDRRAWHLACAASGPDEEVASELERSAGRARARGGLAAAAAFLQRAAALTREPDRRTDRLLAAAQANLQAGAFDAALRLLAAAKAGPLDDLQCARIDLLRGQIAFASGLDSHAPALLLKAAERLAPHDLDLARETYLSAWGAAACAARAGVGDLPEVCRAARALPLPSEPLRPVDLLLEGLTLLITDGRAAAAATLQRAAALFAGEEVSTEERLRWGWLATAASYAMWDIDGTRPVWARQIQLVRDAGALEQLPLYLVALGISTAWSGDFAGAGFLVAEVHEVTAMTGADIPPFGALLLLALRGREEEASTLIEAAVQQAAGARHGIAVTEAQWAAAVLYNGLGRYEQALAFAQQATSDPLDLYPSMWALPELVEAAARSGRADVASAALERLARTTQPAATDFGLGIEARSRALLAEGDVAEALHREAIERLERTNMRPELARAHLLYGEWLRRDGRRRDAREELRSAHQRFAEMGMEAFAERARRELLATGETVRKRSVATRDDLTAQEEQIARLARDGLSNPEIGSQLFISPRTVEWHLRKVFMKLGIRTRNELRMALPDLVLEKVSA